MSSLATFTSLVCLLLVMAFGGVSAQCRDGWTVHGESCYLYVKDMYNWFNAKITCETLESRLVEIETAQENGFLASLIHDQGDYHKPWIGLTDFEEEGTFRWVSSNEAPEVSHWKAGEPDDSHVHIRYGPNGQDCAAMLSTGEWFDGHCETDHRTFICEKEGSGTDNEMIG